MKTFYIHFSLALVFLIAPARSAFSQHMKAVNDTINLIPGYPKTVNLLANDTIPQGDSVYITGGTTAGGGVIKATWHQGGYYTYLAENRGFGNFILGRYKLNNATTHDTSTAQLVFRIFDHSLSTLDVNDVSALFNCSGNHFYAPFAENPGPRFIVPKGSGKSSIFSSAFWIGGLDETNVLHSAFDKYRQGPGVGNAGKSPDFYAGPVMDSLSYSDDQDTTWSYIWNIKRSDIEYHMAHWQDAGYVPILDIRTWPGNGDIELGQASQLAPYHDQNNDGVYDPFAGDYPWIRGDQALFFIFNDDRGPHKESLGNKMKVEIHGMGYAWDIPGDSAFSKTIFLNYKIYNRSSSVYHDTYAGIFTDIDLGFPQDDYLICDVERGSYIGYNGPPKDGNGETYAYGDQPPAQAVTLLAGPLMQPTGADRPKFDNGGDPLCDESVNGTGFGDGIPDNERLGMSTFMFPTYSNSGFPSYLSPSYHNEYYNYMKAIWRDSTQMIYGGNGHEGFGGYGPACRFYFPGESDTLNWGVGCQMPNGPVNWTETTAGNNPHDIAGIGSFGPVTFNPGEFLEIDVAYTWARDYDPNDTTRSIRKLRNMIDIIRNGFTTNTLPGGGSFLGMSENTSTPDFKIELFPNPASTRVTVAFGEMLKTHAEIQLISSAGKIIRSYFASGGSQQVTLDLSGCPTGLYLLMVRNEGIIATRKLSVIK
ncbi:MAG: T9SS type A sorting domain-containing protein [bacterium]